MSLGSLTTTFTPPSACQYSLNNVYWTIGTALVVGPGVFDLSSCMPSNYQVAPTNYYSPGICPAEYTSACSTTTTYSSTTETWITCCPSSLTCGGDYGCSSAILPPATIREIIVNSSSSVQTVLTTFTMDDAGQGVNAYSIQVRLQATDFQTPSSKPTSTSSLRAVPSSPISSVSSTSTSSRPTSSSASNHSKGNLSNGAIAGVAVGAVLGGVLICVAVGLAFCLGRRSANKRREEKGRYRAGEANLESESGAGTWERKELDALQRPYGILSISPIQLPGDELGSHSIAGELDGQQR